MADMIDEQPVTKTVDAPLPDLPELDDDDELDSFFKKKSKKDKKKKKKKDKEGSGDKETDGVRSKKKDDSQSSKDDKKDDNVDEWNDFEDESLRDYSDLKIQNMQITEEPLPTNEPEPEYNEDGELIPPKAEQGPWNKKTAAPVENQSDPIDTSAVEEPKKTGAYRPPGMRSGSAGGGAYRPPGLRGSEGGSMAPLRRTRASQKAPEIGDEMAFPSLSSAAADTESHKGFEVVKNTGAKSVQAWRSKRVQAANSEVRLGNQFSALSSTR